MTEHPVASPACLAAIAAAIARASCPGREGPYGLYDYSAYGSATPHHVRDFRDPLSKEYGSCVLATSARAVAEETYERLTAEHVAQAAVTAYLEFRE